MPTDVGAEKTRTHRSGRWALVQAGLATGLALAYSRAAEPVAASKRTKRIKTRRCRPQVEECVIWLTEACRGDPTCLNNLICCDLFADCNASAAVSCILADAS